MIDGDLAFLTLYMMYFPKIECYIIYYIHVDCYGKTLLIYTYQICMWYVVIQCNGCMFSSKMKLVKDFCSF